MVQRLIFILLGYLHKIIKFTLVTRRFGDFESMSMTLIQRCNNLVSPVGYPDLVDLTMSQRRVAWHFPYIYKFNAHYILAIFH